MLGRLSHQRRHEAVCAATGLRWRAAFGRVDAAAEPTSRQRALATGPRCSTNAGPDFTGSRSAGSHAPISDGPCGQPRSRPTAAPTRILGPTARRRWRPLGTPRSARSGHHLWFGLFPASSAPTATHGRLRTEPSASPTTTARVDGWRAARRAFSSPANRHRTSKHPADATLRGKRLSSDQGSLHHRAWQGPLRPDHSRSEHLAPACASRVCRRDLLHRGHGLHQRYRVSWAACAAQSHPERRRVPHLRPRGLLQHGLSCVR
jgi:hypothetical protein